MNDSERSTLRRPAWRTIPNLVTAVRFALVAPIVVLLLSGAQPFGAAALAAVFGATDWIDGWLARRLRQVSHAGTILDPLADRLGIACIAAALAGVGAVPWWVIAVFPAVDLLVFGVFVIHRERGLSVTRTGKARTGIAMVSVLDMTCMSTDGLPFRSSAQLRRRRAHWSRSLAATGRRPSSCWCRAGRCR